MDMLHSRSMPEGSGSNTTQSYTSTIDYPSYRVVKRNGATTHFDIAKIHETLQRAAQGLQAVDLERIKKELLRNIYDGITTEVLEKALVLSVVAFLEFDPEYDALAARLLLQIAYKEVFGCSTTQADRHAKYRQSFIESVNDGVDSGILNAALLTYDLEALAAAIQPERDILFTYLGAQTIYDRYLLKTKKKRLELPQTFWMRVAAGLALNEPNKQQKALEFYEVISQLHYVPSTPTLFHSGYKTAQLSSCYLSTVNDDLTHIFKVIGDNAQLSKWAGGIGNDWTNIRATGSFIKSIHATSQGVVPYLKIANDVVVGITRSGIRRGGTCVYLETWHLDLEDFLDLRRNTGDERRRTHDINTANWIPDLFMKRVEADGQWTLFSPQEVPDLHDLYGAAFEKRYEEYEAMVREGKIEQYRVVSALKLWRKMLSRLFETGHPWITFKDPCNLRSPQDHVGVVHSSNLCTEITLNTSEDETAVCNLGSINLARHTHNGSLDLALLRSTIRQALSMLDNVIDLNFYPTKEAQTSNMRHRPVGLGLMGFQDALFNLNINFDSQEAIEFADMVQEHILYFALEASSDLAAERGAYESYKGSKWDRGIFPQDTIDLLEKERGSAIECSRTSRLDWDAMRAKVKKHGLRNSNMLAVAPTATISNISGCYPCIEPLFKNIYVKSNLAGEFTIINKYLIADLKQLNLWNEEMVEYLKYYDGDLSMIPTIPAALKRKYKNAFELDPEHLIKITAVRGKWIDQSQSHNVFMQGVSGKKLHDIYFAAWKAGLKTTYYLRTLGASQIEKSTLDAKKFGFTQKRSYAVVDGSMPSEASAEESVVMQQTKPEPTVVNIKEDAIKAQFAPGVTCDPLNKDCESCQ